MKKSQRRSGVSGRAGDGAEAGFTLVEALVAIVILAFGLIAVTNLLVVASSSNQVGNYSTATAAVASETLEKIQGLDFFFICPQAGAPQPVQQCPAGGSLTADVGPANITAEVTVGGALTFHSQRRVNGIANGPNDFLVRTRWQIWDTTQGSPTASYYIVVQSRVDGPFGGSLSQARFAGYRACTAPGCP
jgi:type II secretory pathway pseudopilin PulG